MGHQKALILLSLGFGITCNLQVNALDRDTVSGEANFLAQIKELDQKAKQDPDLQHAKLTAKESQELRRKLAAFYHKQKQFEKIIPLYDELIQRDLNLLSVGAVDRKELSADYKYEADMLAYLDRDSEAESKYKKALSEYNGPESLETRKNYAVLLRKMKRDEEAGKVEQDIKEVSKSAQPGSAGFQPASKPSSTASTKTMPSALSKTIPSASGKSAGSTQASTQANVSPEYAGIEALCSKAQQMAKSGNLPGAEEAYQRALSQISADIEPELKRKMFANIPGYDLNRWHGSMIKQAEILKNLADVQYKSNDLPGVRKSYEQRVRLLSSAGIENKNMEADYAYLLALYQATPETDTAVHYYIALLKARRSNLGESNPTVRETLDAFAKYMRKIHRDDKAAMLEARSKAISSGAKLPDLWFSF